jgi:hypothetical protein
MQGTYSRLFYPIASNDENKLLLRPERPRRQ